MPTYIAIPASKVLGEVVVLVEPAGVAVAVPVRTYIACHTIDADSLHGTGVGLVNSLDNVEGLTAGLALDRVHNALGVGGEIAGSLLQSLGEVVRNSLSLASSIVGNELAVQDSQIGAIGGIVLALDGVGIFSDIAALLIGSILSLDISGSDLVGTLGQVTLLVRNTTVLPFTSLYSAIAASQA